MSYSFSYVGVSALVNSGSASEGKSGMDDEPICPFAHVRAMLGYCPLWHMRVGFVRCSFALRTVFLEHANDASGFVCAIVCKRAHTL